MPNMDGFEVTKKLESLIKHSIVALSAAVMDKIKS